MNKVDRFLLKRYIVLTNALDNKIDEFKNNEIGAVTMIEIVIIVVALIAVGAILNKALGGFITKAFEEITKRIFG